MKKIKIIFWLIVIGFVLLVVYQNQGLFLSKQRIIINLSFANYHTPEVPIAILFLACFLIGLLVSYFFNLSEKFKSKKMIKSLNATLDSYHQKISELKNELGSKKDTASEESTTPAA